MLQRPEKNLEVTNANNFARYGSKFSQTFLPRQEDQAGNKCRGVGRKSNSNNFAEEDQ